jgi:3'(2'), 5'-bisphosphate nucleotidase
LPVKERRMIGSSLKFCAIADGSADIYPRFGATMEWDTAAGDAILRAAGGIVLGRDGQPLRYGKSASKFMNGSFVAWGDRAAVPANLGARLA